MLEPGVGWGKIIPNYYYYLAQIFSPSGIAIIYKS